jgi:hypothetical protein
MLTRSRGEMAVVRVGRMHKKIIPARGGVF